MCAFVLASANPGKVSEISELLGNSIHLVPRPAGMPHVAETGVTLTENARIKAIAVVQLTAMPAIADDTGLEVDALGGAPGVYSARYAGENASYGDNVDKLLQDLAFAPEPRTARFRTVAIAVFPDGRELIAEGQIVGSIASTPRGLAGFGYDSVFVPGVGDGRTFAEMTSPEKNRLSHRGEAFRSLRRLLSEMEGQAK